MLQSRRLLTLTPCVLALAWATIVTAHLAAQASSPQPPAPRSPEAERARWDRMFEMQPAHVRWEPNRFLIEVEATLMPGTAIDVGTGAGRNAVFLATRGWDVTGLDTSAVGVAKAVESAKAKGTTIRAEQADQFAFDYGHERYDLIVWMYMGPVGELGARFVEALKPGGHLVIEHFAGGFAPGSLPEIFKGLEVLRNEEVEDFPDYDLRTRGKVMRFLARKAGR